jgi:5,6,7,8-tetrahydromethanopterin hydro-lyase
VSRESLDGRIGEGWGGVGVLGAHVNLLIAEQGTATAAAAAAVLGQPAPGHVPFLVAAGPGTVIRPATVFVNKTTLDHEHLERLTWGAGQIGVARAVLDALADGALDVADAASLVLLVACWLDAGVRQVILDAETETVVCAAVREAMGNALRDAIQPAAPDAVAALVERRDEIGNGFYGGR